MRATRWPATWRNNSRAAPWPGMFTAGATSASGRSTNARACMRGCGIERFVTRMRRRPNSSRSRSSVRGAFRRPSASRAAMATLDRVEPPEQRAGRKRGPQHGDRIDIVRLRRGIALRRRQVVRGKRNQPRSRQPAQRAHGARELPARVLEIAAEADIGERHRLLSKSLPTTTLRPAAGPRRRVAWARSPRRT